VDFGNFGYCKTQEIFEDLLDRLKIVRKSIFRKIKGVNLMNDEETEVFIPLDVLKEFAKYLPCN